MDNLIGNKSPIELAHDSMGEARALARRVDLIVGRLIGHFPEADDHYPPPSDSILGDLASHAENTRRSMKAANAELDRLESCLPSAPSTVEDIDPVQFRVSAHLAGRGRA